jgi:hypothetical protein
MFTRLVILLFVFFAVAGLLRVTMPESLRVARQGPDQADTASPQPTLTIDRIITGAGGHQP